MKTLSSRAIIGSFYNRLELNVGTEWISKLAMLFQSDQESEEYRWLGASPAMREWIGGRNPKGLSSSGEIIKNQLFEATLEIDIDDLRRDKTGQILVRVDEMADRTNDHWAKLLSSLIMNAESSICYDGQYFFDTDHEEGKSGTQSNKITVDISTLPVNQHGSALAPSPEEMEMTILKGIESLLSFKDDQGEPMNPGAKEFLVMCPVSYLQSALAATKNPVLSSGKTSTIATSNFSIEPIVNPRLNWTDKLSIFRADGAVKPFIKQEETPVEVDAIAEGSELEFKERKHWYGVSASRNVGYGYWQHACQVQLI